jgi:Glycine zipper
MNAIFSTRCSKQRTAIDPFFFFNSSACTRWWSLRSKPAIVALAVALAVSGCANLTTTEQRTLSGASIGALGGAAVAAVAGGSVATGALIGAGVGAGAGYLYSRSQNVHHAGYHPTKHHQHAIRAAKPSKPNEPVRTSDQLAVNSENLK